MKCFSSPGKFLLTHSGKHIQIEILTFYQTDKMIRVFTCRHQRLQFRFSDIFVHFAQHHISDFCSKKLIDSLEILNVEEYNRISGSVFTFFQDPFHMTDKALSVISARQNILFKFLRNILNCSYNNVKKFIEVKKCIVL